MVIFLLTNMQLYGHPPPIHRGISGHIQVHIFFIFILVFLVNVAKYSAKIFFYILDSVM